MDSLTLMDMFLRGAAAGAMLLMALSALRPEVGREYRLALVLMPLSAICWLITESRPLFHALGGLYLFYAPAAAVAACFWLFVLTAFEDAPFRWRNLAPAAFQAFLGVIDGFLPPHLQALRWWVLNATSAVLMIHALAMILRGWSGDLVEGRRQVRGVMIGLAALFGLANVFLAFASRLDPQGPWLLFTISRSYGGALMSIIVVATAAIFAQIRTSLLGAARRPARMDDSRAEAADRQLLGKLNEAMAADGWRREGLTIGALAGELDVPEHRLRRLINKRLGYRNFAEFVNSHRIEAAKRRLGDPAEVRTTVAAIAFDLGYGSLGPFNRAFRSATGVTPTEWRRQALRASPDLQEAG